jgi:hypothetical protein
MSDQSILVQLPLLDDPVRPALFELLDETFRIDSEGDQWPKSCDRKLVPPEKLPPESANRTASKKRKMDGTAKIPTRRIITRALVWK